MATQTEKYVLTEEETNNRNAILFLKGCIVQHSIDNGMKYSSTKGPNKHFKEGAEDKTRKKITIYHIVHNRLRHNRPHTESYESDQKLLTDFGDERWYNRSSVKNITEQLLEKYNVAIPGLEA